MSSNEEEKPEAKSYPLDLAKMSGNKPTEGKTTTTATPILIPGGQPLRGFRIMPQAPTSSTTTGGATIITNIVPQGTIIKQGQGQPQVSANITLQRQITFPVVAQTSSHLPRGASVVANLSAPRSNVAGAIRGPLVVTAAASGQATNLVRNTRAPAPAQGTTWISTSSANGSQVKGVPTVLPVARAATIIAGKPSAVVAKPQVGQIVNTIKPNTTILQSAIIGQNQKLLQLHQFKNAVPGIQTLNTNVALAQVVPARTQTLVYSAPGFTPSPRITVASTVHRGQTTVTTRPIAQVTAARLAVPVPVGTTRILAPQGAVLTPTARFTTIPAAQASVPQPTRIISTSSLGRIAVAMTNAPTNTTVNPVLTQMRSTTLVVPTSNIANRAGNVQGTKVIAQPTQAIHLTPLPQRTINPQTTTSQRPAVSSHTMGITKVYQGQEGQPTSLYLQAPAAECWVAARRTSPGPASVQAAPPTTSITKYPSFYEEGGFSLTRTFGQASGTTITAITSTSQASTNQRPVLNASSGASIPNQSNRFNPIMAAGDSRSYQDNSNADMQNVQTKMTTSSPRPSILRKREHDSNIPLKAAKNLMSSLANLQQPLSPPSRPDSRNNGHSSGGSTTISATSSPGLADANDDSNQHMPMNKEEEENRPPLEMSPRKKPRKQNLAGNDMDENNDDMQFISERDIKREHEESDGMNSDVPQDGAPESRRGVANIRKPASASLLNYMQRWKTTNNHYQRYSDVRPKDERRPTIIEMSNQHRVLEKVNGWKIHHLSTQMEDLADEEHSVHNQLSDILKFTDKQDLSNPDINRITELIKGNMQRVKIIKDGMVEANSAIMKIFDHKVHVTDIINRCASKRNYKKREKT